MDPQTYLIFGGTGGIGSSLARLLSSQQHRVVAIAREPARLAALAAETGAITHALDATDSVAVRDLLQGIARTHERIHGVANCVGSLLLKPAHLTSDSDWDGVLRANLTTSFNIVRASVQMMMQNGGGSIALCSSVAATRGIANHEAIAAAKAGIEGLARATAATYARFGIRVNCVAPGLTRTPLTQILLNSEAATKSSVAMHPLGRIGEPADIASALAWLLSPSQTWVTGQVIGVDGGLSHVHGRA